MTLAQDRESRQQVVVAIDGPSGVGKSSVARKVASELDLPFLDTGAMYRSLALQALRLGLNDRLDDAELDRLLSSLRLDLRVEGGEVILSVNGVPVGDEIRTEEVSRITSVLAALPKVRAWMVKRQQEFGRNYGGVVEGRDIGTVVFPETPHKFFLDASNEVRAERRWRQHRDQGLESTVESVAADLEARDRRDRQRSESPLVCTQEHQRIDTSDLSEAEVVSQIAAQVREIRPRP